jgi:hypothetical protein
VAFDGHKEESTPLNDVLQDPRKRLKGTRGGNRHGIHETMTRRALIGPNVALLKGAGIQSGAGIDINVAKKFPNGSQARII